MGQNYSCKKRSRFEKTSHVSNALALSQKPKVTKLQEQELGIKDVGVSAALALWSPRTRTRQVGRRCLGFTGIVIRGRWCINFTGIVIRRGRRCFISCPGVVIKGCRVYQLHWRHHQGASWSASQSSSCVLEALRRKTFKLDILLPANFELPLRQNPRPKFKASCELQWENAWSCRW